MTVIVVMGVAGSGKTTVGARLAERFGVVYAEADSFHPQANIDKMTAGVPLTDADREPWLAAIAAWIGEHADTGGVVSCSALRRRYRDVLRAGGDCWFLHLDGSRTVIADRMSGRTGHFMPVELLDSQFSALEPLTAEENGLVVEVSEAPESILDRAVREFSRRRPDVIRGVR